MNDASLRPTYRSAFGGLWVDRDDASALLDARLASGALESDEEDALRQYIDHGYAILPQAVSHALVDEYVEFFERAWHEPPRHVYAHSGGEVLPMSMALRDRVAKVSDLHYFFPKAGEIVFSPAVRRFLERIYERPAAVFQSMSMRKGSEEILHIDTGPLTLSEPMSLAAAWIALEDVVAGAGPFQYVPGSHRIPETLNAGVSKGHNGDMAAYSQVLQSTLDHCAAAGLSTHYFIARKGDVLIWSADLMHGGAPIADHSLTRQSLVCHYMPLGVLPTFYDASPLRPVEYRGGGWHLNRFGL
jgi:phytanoyl-CoA hydroxylase